jgi:hypothetical protein
VEQPVREGLGCDESDEVRMRLLTAGSIAGALWCLFLAPIQSAIWNADEPGPAPLIVSLMGAVIDLGGPIHRTVGAPLGLTPYEFWGRLFLPVYLGAIAGVLVIADGRSWPTMKARSWRPVIISTA